jgi:hypothetical protein
MASGTLFATGYEVQLSKVVDSVTPNPHASDPASSFAEGRPNTFTDAKAVASPAEVSHEKESSTGRISTSGMQVSSIMFTSG